MTTKTTQTIQLNSWNGTSRGKITVNHLAVKDCKCGTIVVDLYYWEEGGIGASYSRITKANKKSYYAVRCRPDGTFIPDYKTEMIKASAVRVLVKYESPDQPLAICDGSV